MSRRRPFTDRAGYTRHCWECVHAKDWHDGWQYVRTATCELTGFAVDKYDSPNNPCSHTGIGCRYEIGAHNGNH